MAGMLVTPNARVQPVGGMMERSIVLCRIQLVLPAPVLNEKIALEQKFPDPQCTYARTV